MRKTLEDFYYGNIVPCERQMAHGSDLAKLIRSQHEIDSITALENFILGFRLGVRMMAECMDDHDGDIQEVTDDG